MFRCILQELACGWLSYCEELAAPMRVFDVPEVLEVHVVPSEEVRMVSDSKPCFLMVPGLPTATKILFP